MFLSIFNLVSNYTIALLLLAIFFIFGYNTSERKQKRGDIEMENNANESPYEFNDDDDMSVTVHLASGSVDCSIIVILTVKDVDYMVLLPLDSSGNTDEGEVWFYRYIDNTEDLLAEPILEYIDSDEEFEGISTAFQEYLDNSEYDEIFDSEI